MDSRTGLNGTGIPCWVTISREVIDRVFLPEVEVLHEGVGEANFGPVDRAITGCFNES